MFDELRLPTGALERHHGKPRDRRRKVGAQVEEFADGLTILPGALHGAVLDTYNDHRMAMGMALIGLTVPGLVLRNPACVAKTYPRFFEDLQRLRA